MPIDELDDSFGNAPLASTRIRVPKTSEIVADKFRDQIVRGELGEGDFLPPEGQLMETLGISRPTLREAFRILEAESLITVVRGSRTGAKVHKPSVDLVSRYAGYVLQAQKTTIADLYEARLAIEPHVVRRLATNPDPAVVARLRQATVELERLIDAGEFAEFYVGVEGFHHLIVALTANKTLAFLNNMLIHLLTSHQIDYVHRHPRPPEIQRKSLIMGVRSYQKLINLIEAGDVTGAISHWRLHLKNANASWLSDNEGERIVDSLGR